MIFLQTSLSFSVVVSRSYSLLEIVRPCTGNFKVILKPFEKGEKPKPVRRKNIKICGSRMSVASLLLSTAPSLYPFSGAGY